jgi:hypothetical protein
LSIVDGEDAATLMFGDDGDDDASVVVLPRR